MSKVCLTSVVAVLVLACEALSASNAVSTRPNIVLILADDLGFSDIGCYGGEAATPNLDRLAAEGIRFSQFYNAARCCPTRASLLTGLYPHQAGVGDMVDEYARAVRERFNSPGYTDHLSAYAPTLAEVLRAAGYRTWMSGKWHLGYRTNEWPVARGFDRSFTVIEGAMNYHGYGMQHTGIITNPPMALDGAVFVPPREGFFATDAFTDKAVRFIAESNDGKPFFLYLAYNAPHWPLHAGAADIARYRGKFKSIGWDKLRQQRLDRLKASGILDAHTPLAPRPPRVPAWESASPAEQDQWDLEMSIYAAQIERMDKGIGHVLAALKATGQDEKTLVIFLSDNGGAAEDPNRSLPGAVAGTRESYEGYRIHGAHVSSAPFRKTKKFAHEGGIAAPLILHGGRIDSSLRGTVNHEVAHVIDFMPTFLQLAGAVLPDRWNERETTALPGVSLVPALHGKHLARDTPLFWEHEGNRAVREGQWKIVSSFGEDWELYDLSKDRAELNNIASAAPDRVQDLIVKYNAWAARSQVLPWVKPAPAPQRSSK